MFTINESDTKIVIRILSQSRFPNNFLFSLFLLYISFVSLAFCAKVCEREILETLI